MAVTHYPRSGGRETRQGRHGLFGAIFLEEANHRVQHHDGQDSDAIDHLTDAAETRAAPISTQMTRFPNWPTRSASGETAWAWRSSLGP